MSIKNIVIDGYIEFLDISCCHAWDPSYLNNTIPTNKKFAL